jgi:hypothetical protein
MEEPVFAVIGAEAGGQLARLIPDGGTARVEVTGHGAQERPSPDGERVALTVRAEDGWNLALRDMEGGDTITLTTRAGDEYPEGWSPDGRYLLYWEATLLAGGRDRSQRLIVRDVASGEERPLTELGSRGTPSAAWSPDGTRIAFVADVRGESEVFVVDFDGENLRNVSRSPARDSNPGWSPDGARIAFVSDRDGTPEIYVVRRDGSELRRVTETAEAARTPLWASPTLLLFVLAREAGQDLWATDVTTGEIGQLTRRGDVSSLAVNVRIPKRKTWLERVTITPRRSALSLGEHFQLEPVAIDAAGDTLGRDVVDVRWSVGDRSVVEPDSFGYRVLAPGRTTIVASAAGWRADTLRVFSLPLVEQRADILLDEDWTGGLDQTRWTVFGDPLPTVEGEGGPEGRGGVFYNNGDAHFASGVVSKDTFSVKSGFGVEVYGRMPFTRRLFQSFAIVLYPQTPVDSTDWLATTPRLELLLKGPAANEPQEALVRSPGWTSRIPFPERASEWRRYALQLTPDGTVEVIIDGRLHWRSSRHLPLDSLGAVRLGLGYQSLSTSIAHGPLRVYRPPRYLLVQVDPTNLLTFPGLRD